MRRHYLDNVRSLAIVLVAVYHVFYLLNASGVIGSIATFAPVQYQDAYLYFVYPWFMVLLFVVAGMSARYALAGGQTSREFLRSRTVKLLVPSTLGLLVFQWILGLLNIYTGDGLAAILELPAPVVYLIAALSGTGPLWFAQTLWLYSALLVPLRKWLDRLIEPCGKLPPVALPLLVLPLWAGAQVGNVPMVTVYRLGIYAVAFLLGYLVLAHDKMQEWLAEYRLPLLAAALVAGYDHVTHWFGQDYTASECLCSFATNLYAWIAVLAVLGCAKAWLDFSTPLTERARRSSYGVYVLHYLFALLSCLLLKVRLDLPAAVVYPLASLLTLGGAYLCYELLRRIPFVRFAVLGETKRRA